MKTSELKGPALDWAVGKCWWHGEFYRGKVWIHDKTTFILNTTSVISPDKRYLYSQEWKPSTDWNQAGPIIEREEVGVQKSIEGDWIAFISSDALEMEWISRGPTPLIAAMRCYVASKMGDEIEIPKELL